MWVFILSSYLLYRIVFIHANQRETQLWQHANWKLHKIGEYPTVPSNSAIFVLFGKRWVTIERTYIFLQRSWTQGKLRRNWKNKENSIEWTKVDSKSIEEITAHGENEKTFKIQYVDYWQINLLQRALGTKFQLIVNRWNSIEIECAIVVASVAGVLSIKPLLLHCRTSNVSNHV